MIPAHNAKQVFFVRLGWSLNGRWTWDTGRWALGELDAGRRMPGAVKAVAGSWMHFFLKT